MAAQWVQPIDLGGLEVATYTLHTERLRSAAADNGDTSLYRIHKRTGIDLTVLSRVTRGENAPSLDTAVRLAAEYGVPVEKLLCADGHPLAA